MSESGAAMVVREADSAALAAPGDFGPEHMRIVREAFAPTASQAEFEVMWAGAKARGLDPVKKQIHFVKRRAKRDGEWVDTWTSIVSIDGFRSIAASTGQYDGQDEPEYEYDASEALVLARVRVYRKDVSRPFVGVARWNEYVQTNADGKPNATWAKMEHTMLGKCAEALGLRKAFPEKLGGLYTSEEMAQASNEAPPERRGGVAAARDPGAHTGHRARLPAQGIGVEIEQPYEDSGRPASPPPVPPARPPWAAPIFAAAALRDALAAAVAASFEAPPDDVEHPGRVLDALREAMRARGVDEQVQARVVVDWRKAVDAEQKRRERERDTVAGAA